MCADRTVRLTAKGHDLVDRMQRARAAVLGERPNPFGRVDVHCRRCGLGLDYCVCLAAKLRERAS